MIKAGFLKEKLEDLYFIELKDSERPKALESGTPIPVHYSHFRSMMENGGEVFEGEAFIQGILYLGGLDPEFKYIDNYSRLLSDAEPGYFLSLIMKLVPYDSVQALITSIGAINLGSTDKDILLIAGNLCDSLYAETEDENYLKLAYRVYKFALGLYPDSGEMHYHMAFVLYNSNRFKLAREHFATSLRLGFDEYKEEVIGYMALAEGKESFEAGSELILNGRVHEGMELLLGIRDDFTDWYELNFFLGLGSRLMEEYDAAIHYFIKAKAIRSDDISLLNEMGMTYTLRGEHEKAIETLSDAAVLSPADPQVLCNLGIAFYEKGDTETALGFIEKSLESDPEDEITISWKKFILNN